MCFANFEYTAPHLDILNHPEDNASAQYTITFNFCLLIFPIHVQQITDNHCCNPIIYAICLNKMMANLKQRTTHVYNMYVLCNVKYKKSNIIFL